MADPRFVLVNLAGEISHDETFSNPFFAPSIHGSDTEERVKPGDIAALAARITELGYHRPATAMPGVAGLRWSLDGVDYTADGDPSDTFDATYEGVALWVMASSVQAGPVVVDVSLLQADIVVISEAPEGSDAGIGADDGTTPTAGIEAPDGVDAGTGTDDGDAPTSIATGTAPTGSDEGTGVEDGDAPTPAASAPTGADAGAGADTGTTPSAGSSAPSGTDAGVGANTGTTPGTGAAIPSGTDAGIGANTGTTPTAEAGVFTGTRYFRDGQSALQATPGDGSAYVSPALLTGQLGIYWGDDTHVAVEASLDASTWEQIGADLVLEYDYEEEVYWAEGALVGYLNGNGSSSTVYVRCTGGENVRSWTLPGAPAAGTNNVAVHLYVVAFGDASADCWIFETPDSKVVV